MLILLILVIVAALAFDFLNGIHGSSTIVATMISSRAFHPRVALGITATAEFFGPFIFGVAVANTIGREIAVPEAVSLQVVLAALLATTSWSLLTWYIGFPSSASHALVSGIVGAVIMGSGWQAIRLEGLQKVLVALFASPVVGFIVGFLFNKLVLALCWRATPKVNVFFKRGQIVTAIVLALSYGANDAPKAMGMITLALVSGGYLAAFEVPWWVMLLSAGALALGTAMGGWRLIRTLGGKFYKIRPIHGFSSQFASAIVVLVNSIIGGPVSTTQVVSSSIMGVGASERVSKVRWGVVSDILIAWLLTIPASALLAGAIYRLVLLIFP